MLDLTDLKSELRCYPVRSSSNHQSKRNVINMNTITERGWVIQHDRYGKWFISRQIVINEWKKDQADAYPDEASREPTDDEIDMWFYQQITWIEVAQFGRQLERPDMNKWEREWRQAMKRNPDYTGHQIDPIEIK